MNTNDIKKDGFWVTDIKGRFIDANDAYCSLTGYSRQELLGLGISDIEVTENPRYAGKYLEGLTEGGGGYLRVCQRRKDGRIIEVGAVVNRAKIGNKDSLVFAQDGITRVRAEGMLREKELFLFITDIYPKSAINKLKYFSWNLLFHVPLMKK